jgi:hypothetical protein
MVVCCPQTLNKQQLTTNNISADPTRAPLSPVNFSLFFSSSQTSFIKCIIDAVVCLIISAIHSVYLVFVYDEEKFQK